MASELERIPKIESREVTTTFRIPENDCCSGSSDDRYYLTEITNDEIDFEDIIESNNATGAGQSDLERNNKVKKPIVTVLVLAFAFSVAFSYAYTGISDSSSALATPTVCCPMGACPPGCEPGVEWGRLGPDPGGKYCGHWTPGYVCEVFCDCN